MTVAMNSTYLGRIGIYTGVYNTLTWPFLIKKVEPRSRKILILIMLFFYFLQTYALQEYIKQIGNKFGTDIEYKVIDFYTETQEDMYSVHKSFLVTPLRSSSLRM